MELGWKAQAMPVRSWQTGRLDGQIYGEPLLYGSRVYVVTQNDSMYALRVRDACCDGLAFGGALYSAGVVCALHGILYGINPLTGAQRSRKNLGSLAHFATAGAAAGRLFNANGDRVTAFRIATA